MTLAQFVYQFTGIFNGVIALLSAIAVLLFFGGLVRLMFLQGKGDAHAGEKERSLIWWGIIALFVLFALGGILNFFAYDLFKQTVSTGGTTTSASNCTYDSGTGQYTCPGFTPSANGGINTSACTYNANGQYTCNGFH